MVISLGHARRHEAFPSHTTTNHSCTRCPALLGLAFCALLASGCARDKAPEGESAAPPLAWKRLYEERDQHDEDAGNPVVVIATSMGDIEVELFPGRAPITVDNFLRYVSEEYYDGLVFHRVIPGFMVQAGAYTPELASKEPDGTIENEATNGLSNLRGTVAMARRPEPHTASAQFFINLVDNEYLDHRNKTNEGFGYCVFGGVVRGMDVVDRIAQVRTRRKGGMEDLPATDIIIKSVRLKKR